MYRYFCLCLLTSILFACQTTEEVSKPKDFEYISNSDRAEGSIKGRVIEPETKDGAIGAHIRLEGTSIGAVADLEGNFHIQNIPPGSYNLLIDFVGYRTAKIPVEVQAGKMLLIREEIPLELQEVMLEKPMIYLYPQQKTKITVRIDYMGKLTSTYPKYEGEWKVTADNNGKLTDSLGRDYYGLYWEGIPERPIIPDCGTVVSRDSLIPFLENSLDQLGLNYKEANEFIVYWLPRLEQSNYNLIYFAGKDYTNLAKLNIEPKPETLIRVMMGFVPLKSPIEIKPQELPEKRERKGFTVVEWGGTECSLSEM
ncbi:MAG: carboxypeptidase-like regulatory domain-containing protein [Fluviicola sp.]